MSNGAAIVAIFGVGMVLLAAWVWRRWRCPDRRRRAPWFNRPLLLHESGERMFLRMLEQIEEDVRRTDCR